MKERDIEYAVCQWAKAQGALPIKMSAYSTAGYPDRLFLFAGRCVFIEFKAPGRHPRAIQVVRMEELNSLGFEVKVVDSVESGIAFLASTLLTT